jgi:hypothetical protein
MFKTFLLLLGLVSGSFGATFSTVSSNQFKLGTNGIYTASLANLTTLSNSITSSIYVSSNALISTNWSAINSTTATHSSAQVGALTSGSSIVTNNLSAGGLIIGGGTAITKILSATATLDFPATATNQISTLTITVTGAGTNGCAFVNIVTPNSNFTYTATIEATNTVTVRAANISINNAVDPAATAARVVVFQ